MTVTPETEHRIPVVRSGPGREEQGANADEHDAGAQPELEHHAVAHVEPFDHDEVAAPRVKVAVPMGTRRCSRRTEILESIDLKGGEKVVLDGRHASTPDNKHLNEPRAPLLHTALASS